MGRAQLACAKLTDVHVVILILLLLGLVFGPGLWVRRVMSKYARPPDRYPHTGREMARMLLDSLGLHHVIVEESEIGDHYDPIDKAVRLTPDKFAGRSLTAVTVAAHEVGHAMQDRDGYAPLRLRTRLVKHAQYAEKIGAGILVVAPFAALAMRAPPVGLLMMLGGLLSLGTAALVHLVTLPTEFNASFARAYPMIEAGYLKAVDKPHAKRLLRAAALTYVAASLMSLLNVARWIAILRR